MQCMSYRDHHTGRPLPTPRWYDGTQNLVTEQDWLSHIKRMKAFIGWTIVVSFVISPFLSMAWPSPGFGTGTAILLCLWAFFMIPFYVIYRNLLKRYFPEMVKA